MISDSYLRGGTGISIVSLFGEISSRNYLEIQTQLMIRMTKFEVLFHVINHYKIYHVSFDFNKFSTFNYPRLDCYTILQVFSIL